MGTPSPNLGFGVTGDDVCAYDWQAVVESASSKECQDYCDAFVKQASMLNASGDQKGVQVYRLLGAVASFWLEYESDDTPYRAAFTWPDGRRSAIPDDLTPHDLDTLAALVADTHDPEFRARLADVQWVCRKDYKAAQFAVHAYLESSRILESGDNWLPFVKRLQRARKIGAQLGRLKAFHLKAIQAIEDAISRHESSDHELLCARLMHILLADGIGDAKRHAELAKTLALRMEAIPNWHFAKKVSVPAFGEKRCQKGVSPG
jgi:hypothetical protein